MKCLFCGREITEGMKEYSLFVEGEYNLACITCFMLTKIVELLEVIKDDNDRRPKLQVNHGDDTGRGIRLDKAN